MMMSAPSSRSVSTSRERFLDVGRVHLVAAAIAELRRRIGRVAEADRRTPSSSFAAYDMMPMRSRPRSSSSARMAATRAVHHVGGRHEVGAGDGVRQRRVGHVGNGDVVEDLLALEDAAVAVRRYARRGRRR